MGPEALKMGLILSTGWFWFSVMLNASIPKGEDEFLNTPLPAQSCSRPGHLQYLLDSSLLSFCSSPYLSLMEKVCCYHFAWLPQSLQALLWGAFPSHYPPQVWCPLLWDVSIWEDPLCVGRLQEQCSAVCAFLWVSAVQFSQTWRESASTSWARTMMIVIEYFFPGFFFSPSLILLFALQTWFSGMLGLSEACTTEMAVPIETSFISEYGMFSINSLGNKLRMV